MLARRCTPGDHPAPISRNQARDGGRGRPAVRRVQLRDEGPDGAGLQGLHWTSWTLRLASGYGTEYENDCRPDCVQGHIHYYPVLAVLWGSGSVPGHPAERRYTEVTLIYPGARPPVYKLVNDKLAATYPVTQTFPAL